jgi:riboflavin transporter FmnP
MTKVSNRSTQPLSHKITVTALLSAIAFILQYIELPVFFMPGFIKFDFSDLPALLAAFSLGPVYGVVTELIKNLVHLPVSNSAMIGELSNFILGAAFVFTAGLIYKKDRTRKGALLGSIIGAAVMAVVSLPINYYIVYPIYENFMPLENIIGAYQAILPRVKTLWQCLLVFNVPFTLLKGLVDVLITFLIYKKLSPILHK